MSKKRRLFALFAVMLVAIPLFVLSLPNVASADPVPATHWSPASLTDMPNAKHIITDVNGGATVGCGSRGSKTAFKTFSASGSVAQSRPVSSKAEFCAQMSAVGADGTVFVSVYDQYDPAIKAFKKGKLVWSYKPNCGQHLGVNAMTVGANGNLYVLTTQGSSANGCSSSMILGLTPAAQSGTTKPQVVLKKTISGSVFAGGLAAYQDGFVLRLNNQIQYVSMSGILADPINYTSANTVGYSEQFNASSDGRVFVANKASAGASTGCSSADSVAGSISAINPGGAVWTASLQGCSYVYDLRPTYWGGVVAYVQWRPQTGGTLKEKLIAFDQNGEQLWTSTFSTAGLDATYNRGAAIAVDLNGNVALRRNVMVGKKISGSYWRFPEIRFALLSGFTGKVIPGTNFALRGSSAKSSGPSYQWTDSQVRIAKNTAYVLAKKCTNSTNCAGATKLYAFKVPGLEMDYPRGAILQADKPWKNYVAMGDSFSSGEGVEPFISPSDTNGCHRSEKAYAKLLDGNPASKLNLTAFVACSGATTGNLLNGQYGEAAQVDALNSDIDAVTTSAGGNDIGFREFVIQCLFLDCSKHAANQQFFEKVNNLDDKLRGAYDRILAEAPNAEVYVVGYPQVLPNPSSCSNPLDAGVAVLDTVVKAAHKGDGPAIATVFAIGRFAKMSDDQIYTLINAGKVTFTSDEIRVARDLTQELNGKISDTVMSRLSPRLSYIDAQTSGSPFVGHELCKSDTYFNGVDLINSEHSFHPNTKGQDAFKRLIEEYL